MATIQLRTQIPGPKSSALSRRRAAAVPRGLSQATPIYVAKAEGAVLEDVDGNRYLDFAGGIGCQNTGHNFPAAVAAIHEQVDRYLHQCFMVGSYEPYVEVCRRLAGLSPCAGDEARRKSACARPRAQAAPAAPRSCRRRRVRWRRAQRALPRLACAASPPLQSTLRKRTPHCRGCSRERRAP